MHKIVTTQGLVLGKRPIGEANTLTALLTEDLGLVWTRAQSSRLEKSKLRYGLEPLTRSRFSLVRGRQGWRLVGTHDLLSSHRLFHTSMSRTRAGKIVKLLIRLMPGEEPMPVLFTTVIEGLKALATTAEEKDSANIECVLVLRILSHLGYLPQTDALAPFIEQDFFSLELSAEVNRSRALLLRTINESLQATGL